MPIQQRGQSFCCFKIHRSINSISTKQTPLILCSLESTVFIQQFSSIPIQQSSPTIQIQFLDQRSSLHIFHTRAVCNHDVYLVLSLACIYQLIIVVYVQRFFSDPILALYHQLTINTKLSAMQLTDETLIAFLPQCESASKFQPRTINEYLKIKTHLSHTRVGYERRKQRITRTMAAHKKDLSISLAAKRNSVPVLLF